MRKLVILLIAVASVVLGTTVPASAAVYATNGRTHAGPYCDYGFSVATGGGVTPSRTFTVSAWYNACNLVLMDNVYSPSMCSYAFDVEDGSSTTRYCTRWVQNRTSDVQRWTATCKPAHRYKVDVYMLAYRYDPVAGRHPIVGGSPRTLRVVCGGGVW